MPRFYFHLYDDGIFLDDEGQQLANVAAANDVAIANAREMACAEVMDGRLSLQHRIEVTDEGGHTIATVHFRDVVQVDR